MQALDQPCLPEWSQHAANSHQHFQKCLPGKEENTPLTFQVPQLKFSTPFYFLLLSTADGSKTKGEKNNSRIRHNYLIQNPFDIHNCPEQKSQGSGVSLLHFLLRLIAKLPLKYEMLNLRPSPVAQGRKEALIKGTLN